MLRYIFIFIIFFNYLFSSPLADITIGQKDIYNDFELYVYNDKDNSLKINDIKQLKFTKKTKNRFSLGRTKGSFWFKLKIKNTSNKEDFILSIDESFYELYEIYEDTIHSTSLRQKIKDRDVKTNKLALNFNIKQNETKTIYIRLRANFACFGSFILYENSYLQLNNFFTSNTYFIFTLGVFFLIFLFNLFLLLRLKEKIYFYYLSYIIFVFIYTFNISGLATYFDLSTYLYKMQATSSFALGFLILFSLELLEVKKHFPIVFKFTKYIALFTFIIGTLILISFRPWMAVASILYIILTLLLLFIAIAVVFKDKSKSLYYIFVISFYNISLFIFVFMTISILDNTLFTRYSFFVMLFIEVIVFSLMLADRYNELKDKTIKFQNDLIKIKTENEINLENRILERTNEISLLLSDKDLLLKELYHRVKNNFQILLGILWLEDKKASEDKIDLKSIITRINSMSTIHEYLYDSKNISKISLKGYLENIINNISRTYPEINIKTNIEDKTVKLDHAISLGMILNEVFTNSIKHCDLIDNLHINLDLISKEEKVYLSIKDNGRGFDFDKIKKGLGLKIITQHSNKLTNSEHKFVNEDGAKFLLNFSL